MANSGQISMDGAISRAFDEERQALRTTAATSSGANASGVATATLANVSDSATNVTLQAANANRRGWTCWNDSTSYLYVKFGATATATSCTVRLAPDQFYEMPSPVYTGIIDGIWSADASGAARITELTP